MKPEASHGLARALTARDRLDLTSGQESFLVVKGRVRVFAQKAQGRLEPLFTCGPGDALIGSDAVNSEWRLVAIGLPEAGLAPLDLESLACEACEQGPNRMVTMMLENWVSRLMAATCPSVVMAADAFVPTEGVDFESTEGQAHVLRHRFLWLTLAHPTVIWGHAFDRVVAWPAHLVLRFDSRTKGRVIGSSEALCQRDTWDRLHSLQQDCFAWLETRLAVSRETVTRREVELRVFQDRVGDAVESKRWFSGEGSQDLASSNALTSSFVSALTVVCRAVGASFTPPPVGALNATRDPLALCARASGFGYRRVNLDAKWYEGDVGPLLGHMSGDQERWVALIRHRGAFRVHEGTGGLGAPLDEKTDRAIDQTFQIYPALPRGGVIRFLLFRQWPALLTCAVLGVVLGLMAMLPIFVLEFFRGEGHDPALISKPVGLVWALLLWAGGVAFLGLFAHRLVSRIVSFVCTRFSAAIFHRLLVGQSEEVARRSPAERSGMSAELLTSEDHILRLVYGVGAGLGLILSGFSSMAWVSPRSILGCALTCVLIGVMFGTSVRRCRRAEKVLRAMRAEQNSLSASLLGSVSSLRAAGASQRASLMWSVHDAGQQYWRRIVLCGQLFRRRLILLGIALLVVAFLMTGDAHKWVHNPLGVPAAGVSLSLLSVGLIVLGGALGQLSGLLDIAGEVKRLSEAEEVPTGVGIIPDGPSGFIEVDGLTYSLAGEGSTLIDQVSFTVKRGSFVAIVGPSGSGKSTLIRLLLGLIKADSGSIRFDGLDISTLDLVALRERSGVVLQTLSLPKGSIQSIISGGRDLSKEQVLAALKVVGLGALVDSLPMGVNTLVSGNSGVFSGGQMQLLLLARAIAGAPRLVVLDEATSALDNNSQAAAMRAIEQLNATRVVVAHRLSTIRNADHIIVLDKGAIVQEGTFEQLERQDGLFRRLVQSQLKGSARTS